jgi:hypothetical protein
LSERGANFPADFKFQGAALIEDEEGGEQSYLCSFYKIADDEQTKNMTHAALVFN